MSPSAIHRSPKTPLVILLAAAMPWPVGAQPVPPTPILPTAPAAPSKLPEYQQATAALRDKLPEVAIVKLKRALDSGKLKPDQALPLRLLLVEALVRADQPDQVLPLTEDPAIAALPEAKFWRAQALARMNRWQDAELLFASLSTLTDFKLATETVFSRAGMLAALGEPDRASRLLVPLRTPVGTPTAQRAGLWLAELRLSAGSPAEAGVLLDEIAPPSAGKRPPEQQYLKARIALATPGVENAQTADGLFAVLAAGGPDVPIRLQQAARLGRVRALRAQAKSDEALPILRQILSSNPTPTPEILDATFQELETLNHPPSAEMESFLGSLAANADPALKIRARIALAAALETVADSRDATTAWAAILKDFPNDPLRAHALLRQAQYLVSQNRRSEAKPLLEQIRQLSPTPAIASWTAWVAGQSEYDAAAYRAASGYFREASSASPDPSLRAAAAYNAALSELQEGTLNPARSLALLDSSPLPEYKLAGAEFHLERALHLASKGDPDAVDGLQAFADSLPDHPRRFDALIALAELALRADPPRPQDAARLHADALAAATQPWQQERAALLDCYIAEATAPEGNAPATAASADAFTAKALKFLTAFPLSSARTDLRMKTARIAYQREDFSGARQLFETLATDDPLHPLAEPALFWAGRAALLTMEPSAARQAVGFWEKVYERNGPLKWQARLQEAMLNQRQNQPAAALQLLDELLAPTATPAPDPATRWQSLLVKGEILAAPTMKPEEQALGLKAFDQVIAAPGLPPAFKNQALVRKGVCLGTLKRHDEALEAYYDVLTNSPATSSTAASNGTSASATADDYWFHRAGTKALVLLERAGKSEEAIEIAKKLAKAPGPRGRAAAELVDELAFKYGIWTSSP